MGSYVNDLVELIRKNNELESDRYLKEQYFVSEKERLDSEIQELSANKDNIDEIKRAYKELIDIQSNELMS